MHEWDNHDGPGYSEPPWEPWTWARLKAWLHLRALDAFRWAAAIWR